MYRFEMGYANAGWDGREKASAEQGGQKNEIGERGEGVGGAGRQRATWNKKRTLPQRCQ